MSIATALPTTVYRRHRPETTVLYVAQDGALLGRLTRLLVETVLAFYAARAARAGHSGAKTGAVTVVQRTSSDLRLNPHLHLVVLDGAWHEEGGELVWEALSHLRTSEVGEVLERAVRRMERHLRRRGLLRLDEDDDDDLYAKRGQFSEAEALYKEALERDVGNALANLRYGQLLKFQGHSERARTYMKRALDADPGDRRAKEELEELDEG